MQRFQGISASVKHIEITAIVCDKYDCEMVGVF